MGCGVRPEAVPGSASTRPNRDGAAGGIREGEQRLELQGREERLLSATLASEDMALALAATGRSIPVWPRARGARHRLRPHPAAHGTPRSGGAVRALVRHASTPPEPVIALETTLLQRLIELVAATFTSSCFRKTERFESQRSSNDGTRSLGRFCGLGGVGPAVAGQHERPCPSAVATFCSAFSHS